MDAAMSSFSSVVTCEFQEWVSTASEKCKPSEASENSTPESR